MKSITAKRALKHVALFLACAALALLLGYWGAVMSLAAFAPGGDVEFSERQKRTEATGDAMLAVFDWPSRHLLGVDRSWVFSSLAFGAVLYGAVLGAHRCLRKTKSATRP
jgi:hypothetical protein